MGPFTKVFRLPDGRIVRVWGNGRLLAVEELVDGGRRWRPTDMTHDRLSRLEARELHPEERARIVAER